MGTVSEYETTLIEELKAAVKLIREECKKHDMCANCPLSGVICAHGIQYPAKWPVEMIGVDTNESF